MAEDGTTPPSGEDLLGSIRRLVSLREAEALVLTGAQRVNATDTPDDDETRSAWMTRINTAATPKRDDDDPFAHRAPTARTDEDDTWPALSKESLGLVRAGIDYPDDEFEEEDEPVWSGSIMRRPTPAPEPFLLTEPAQAETPAASETGHSDPSDAPLHLTDRIAAPDNAWDDVDQLAARLSEAGPAPERDNTETPADTNDDITAQIEAALAQDIGTVCGDDAPDVAPAIEPAEQPNSPATDLTSASPTLPPALAGEELNALVSAIVREELRGELGIRITRNVRKLVRREIYRAIANGELTRE